MRSFAAVPGWLGLCYATGSMVVRPTFLVPAAILLFAGCGPDPIVEEEVLPYEGEPYPNRVEPIELPAGPVGFVTDSYSDTVSVVDLTAGTRITSRPIGRNPVNIDGPHHIALDREGGFAFIGLSYPASTALGPHASHGSSQVFGYMQKLRLSDLAVVGQVRVDPSPGDIVLSEDGKRVVTSHFDLLRAIENPTDIDKARSTIAVADPATMEEEGASAKLIPVCVAPHGVVMGSPTGSPLYVACYGEDRIAIVDLDDESAPIEYVDVGPGVVGFGAPSYGPYAMLKLADEPTIVVSNTASKDVRFFDTETKTIDGDRTITTLGAPFFPTVSADGTKLVIPTQQPDALVVVDLTGVEDNVTRSFSGAECELPHVVERVGDGYAVVCEGDHQSPGKVIVLDATLEIVSTVEVGIYPDAIALVNGGAR